MSQELYCIINFTVNVVDDEQLKFCITDMRGSCKIDNYSCDTVGFNDRLIFNINVWTKFDLKINKPFKLTYSFTRDLNSVKQEIKDFHSFSMYDIVLKHEIDKVSEPIINLPINTGLLSDLISLIPKSKSPVVNDIITKYSKCNKTIYSTIYSVESTPVKNVTSSNKKRKLNQNGIDYDPVEILLSLSNTTPIHRTNHVTVNNFNSPVKTTNTLL